MKPESWIFTFGFGQHDPQTGEPLANSYIVVQGDINESRRWMEERYGRQWAFQYPNEEAAGVSKWNLRRVNR